MNYANRFVTSISVLLILFSTGCEAKRVSKYKITLFNGGKEIKAWSTYDRPLAVRVSDNFILFYDIENNKKVAISGTFIMEEQ